MSKLSFSTKFRRRPTEQLIIDTKDPKIYQPIKPTSRRVQLQKAFDNFNHSYSYLKNVIRLGNRSQIPGVIEALMDHVNNLLKLSATWRIIISDYDGILNQSREEILTNLSKLLRALDYFEETGKNNEQASPILCKVFISVEKMKNFLFDSLPCELEFDENFNSSQYPYTPPHSPTYKKPPSPQRKFISKSKSIPNTVTRQIHDLDSPSLIRKILNTQTLQNNNTLVAVSNQLSQMKQTYNNSNSNLLANQGNTANNTNYPTNTLPASFSSINIRSSGQSSNNGTPVKSSKLNCYKKMSFPGSEICHSDPPSLVNSSTFYSIESLDLDYYNGSSTPAFCGTPTETPVHTLNDMQYKKRYQANTYDAILNKSVMITYDTDLEAPPLPKKMQRNLIPQLVFHSESIRHSTWENKGIGRVRANSTDCIIDQADPPENLDPNISPKGSYTPNINQKRLTRSAESNNISEDSVLALHPSLLSLDASSPSVSPENSPKLGLLVGTSNLTQSINLNRTLSSLKISDAEYNLAKNRLSAQLNQNPENGLPAIPPKRKQIISYLTFMKDNQSYEFPADTYQPLYVATFGSSLMRCITENGNGAELKPPPMPVKQRHSKSGSESDSRSNGDPVTPQSNPLINNGKELIFSVPRPDPLIMDENDIGSILLFEEQEGLQSLRGGPIDALISYASSSQTGNLFCEAFIHTYSTFICFEELMNKLCRRYYHMKRNDNPDLCTNIIMLLTRIINLLETYITEDQKSQIKDLVYSLVEEDQLLLAIPLKIAVDSYSAKIKPENQSTHTTNNNEFNINLLSPTKYAHMPSYGHLTDFRAVNLAEQITLMDYRLFKMVKNEELLAWARDSIEGTNLTKYTTHFNNLSYWCQTKILTEENEASRKEVVKKLMKIMKYLRKMNNFNSYLAIFSAIESASVSRLDWPEHILKDLEEPRSLLNSSRSFANYRNAYVAVQPPCICYLALYVNDLTFINQGSKEYLDDNKENLNFSKQWTIYQTLKQLDKCRQKEYDFKIDKQVCDYFSGFNEHMSETDLYKISLKIKPRGGGQPS